MAQGTKITPDIARQISNQHQQTVSDIQRQCTSLEGQLSGLMGRMKGQMILKFNEVHSQWQSEMQAVQRRLTEMAENVTTTAGQLDQAGDTGAGKVGSVHISAL